MALDIFPDVAIRASLDTCVRCRIQFKRNDKITQIWAVTGIGRHPEDGRKSAYMNEVPEYGHANCKDAADAENIIIPPVPRELLSMSLDKLIRPRFPEYMCSRCKKTLKREDRVLTVTIVQGIDKDPETNFPAAVCSPEFEIVHVDCKDPTLVMG